MCVGNDGIPDYLEQPEQSVGEFLPFDFHENECQCSQEPTDEAGGFD